MVFVACGLNHKTAPLAVREKIALPVERQDTLLTHLGNLPMMDEVAILSTCNRTEIYCETKQPNRVLDWLAENQQLAPEFISPHFYLHQDHHGVRHTLRVASGLDSMMLGEPQILGQMKQAYQQACRIGTIKNNLRQIFQYVFRASKHIRSHSGIGNNPVSVAFAAVQLIGQHFKHYPPLKIFMIGSGETASLVAKYLQKQGVEQFMVASRTLDNAEKFAGNFSGKAVTISDIPKHLANADVILSATACPLPFITKDMVEYAMKKRHHRPMFCLDLAVPRDIEHEVGDLSNVHLYNVDDLQTMTQKGMEERRTAALQAEQLVECELENYIRWHRSLKAKEVICHYRSEMQELAHQELQRAMQKITSGHCQERVLTEFSERLINKLIHAPTVGLRQAAWDNRQDLLDLAHYLFNLNANQSNPYEKVT